MHGLQSRFEPYEALYSSCRWITCIYYHLLFFYWIRSRFSFSDSDITVLDGQTLGVMFYILCISDSMFYILHTSFNHPLVLAPPPGSPPERADEALRARDGGFAKFHGFPGRFHVLGGLKRGFVLWLWGGSRLPSLRIVFACFSIRDW